MVAFPTIYWPCVYTSTFLSLAKPKRYSDRRKEEKLKRAKDASSSVMPAAVDSVSEDFSNLVIVGSDEDDCEKDYHSQPIRRQESNGKGNKGRKDSEEEDRKRRERREREREERKERLKAKQAVINKVS